MAAMGKLIRPAFDRVNCPAFGVQTDVGLHYLLAFHGIIESGEN
jgi:hypothetical protein